MNTLCECIHMHCFCIPTESIRTGLTCGYKAPCGVCRGASDPKVLFPQFVLDLAVKEAMGHGPIAGRKEQIDPCRKRQMQGESSPCF